MRGDRMAECKLKVFGFKEEDYPELDGKCLECNNETDSFYALAVDENEAKELLKNENDGVCGSCMVSRLIEMCGDGYSISK